MEIRHIPVLGPTDYLYHPNTMEATPPPLPIIHDKTPLIASFLTPLLGIHRGRNQTFESPNPPFFLGLSGIQGSGKTTLCNHLTTALRSSPHNLRALTISIDDLYLPHSQLSSLSALCPLNPFLRQRGPPGTHDVELGEDVLSKLAIQKEPVKIPRYDKSKHGGKGDRLKEDLWDEETPPWDVVILEGWCVGFRSLPEEQVERKWGGSKTRGEGTLGTHRLEDLLWINRTLGRYTGLWDRLDALVHM